jgi:hypothetical protein
VNEQDADLRAVSARPDVSERVRHRANNARCLAKRGVGLVVLVVCFLVGVFLSFSISIPGPGGPHFDPLPAPTARKQSATPPGVQNVDSLTPDSSDRQRRLDELVNLARASVVSVYLGLAQAAIARLASVVLAIYLVQILSSYVRYHFRMADHLDACADALAASHDDADDVAALLNAFSPRWIEFGAVPRAPTEQLLDAVRDLIAKLPPKT